MFASARLKAVIAISKMVADDLVRHYAYPRERIHHIPNGIDLDRFHPSLRRHRTGMRRKLDVPDDYHVVLFVGTGFSRKGLDVAIDAVARLKNRAELWVVGRDRRPNHYLSLANKAGLSGRYRYFGPQADPLPWYGAADVTILPSSYEPFGLTALESMACGVPSVVSKHCGVREVVEQFDPALVCNADNTDEVVQALELALDMAFRPEISERIRATAKRYGLDQMIERSIRLYAELQN